MPALRCAALRAGGVLAPFWNRAAWGESELRDALAEAHRQIVPDMATDGPMHPLNPSPEADDDWMGSRACASPARREARYYGLSASRCRRWRLTPGHSSSITE